MKKHISQRKKRQIDIMLAINEELLYHVERNIEKIEKLLRGKEILQGVKADKVIVDEALMWKEGQDTKLYLGDAPKTVFKDIDHD